VGCSITGRTISFSVQQIQDKLFCAVLSKCAQIDVSKLTSAVGPVALYLHRVKNGTCKERKTWKKKS
jgi:hypothetical protein